MKKIIFILVLLLFFIQYSFLSMVDKATEVNLGILLSFLLVIFLRRNYLEGVGWAIFSGLLVDYFSSTPFGFQVINFMVLVFAVDILKRKIALKEMHFSIVALVVFFGLIFSDLLATLLVNLLGLAKIIKQDFAGDFLFSIKYFLIKIILAAIGFLFYRMILAIERVLGIGAREIKIDKM